MLMKLLVLLLVFSVIHFIHCFATSRCLLMMNIHKFCTPNHGSVHTVSLVCMVDRFIHLDERDNFSKVNKRAYTAFLHIQLCERGATLTT